MSAGQIAAGRRSVAIVGAGPAGLFTAQALRRALPDADIVVIDRLPAPFGLLRYGVAPDHQGTKAIARQFERLFERENVAFRGDIEIGRDLSLEDLRRRHAVVVIAAGLSGDRRLAIPGDDLPGVIGSGRLTRWLNDHPGEATFEPRLGRRVAIIGNGNVALDIARILAKSEGEFKGSDLSPRTLAALVAAGVQEITVIGRSPPESARFDAALVREFARLSATHVSVDLPAEAAPSALIAALREIDGAGPEPRAALRRLTFRFGLTPTAIAADGDGLRLRLSETGDVTRTSDMALDSIVTAIGFESEADALPRSDWAQADGTLPIRIEPGLYAAGWFRRGPRGTIPDNRAEAKAVADVIAADIAAGIVPGRDSAGSPTGPQGVSYAGWSAIRDQEIASAPAGRVRLKCPTLAAMRAIAAGVAAP